MLEADKSTTDFLALDGPAVVNESCERMLALIDELLAAPCAPDAPLTLTRAKTDVGAVVRHAVERFQAPAQRKNIRVTADVVPDLPAIEADPLRLAQILDNLISNGVKYSDTGCHVRVRARLGNAGVEVTVADDGQGIPEAELPRLFKTGGTTSARPTAGEPSTGYGLAIVKRIAEAHGGTVGLESTVGVGTTVTVHLPLN
jgi:signal transduction histidine kinase